MHCGDELWRPTLLTEKAAANNRIKTFEIDLADINLVKYSLHSVYPTPAGDPGAMTLPTHPARLKKEIGIFPEVVAGSAGWRSTTERPSEQTPICLGSPSGTFGHVKGNSASADLDDANNGGLWVGCGDARERGHEPGPSGTCKAIARQVTV